MSSDHSIIYQRTSIEQSNHPRVVQGAHCGNLAGPVIKVEETNSDYVFL